MRFNRSTLLELSHYLDMEVVDGTTKTILSKNILTAYEIFISVDSSLVGGVHNILSKNVEISYPWHAKRFVSCGVPSLVDLTGGTMAILF